MSHNMKFSVLVLARISSAREYMSMHGYFDHFHLPFWRLQILINTKSFLRKQQLMFFVP